MAGYSMRIASFTRRILLGAAATAALPAVGAHAQGQPSPAGRWLAEDIFGGGVIDRLQSVLEIDAAGRVTGMAGCNRIMGQAAVDGAALTFGRIASTKIACSPAVMDQERKFLDALGRTKSFRLDAPRRKLILLDADGKTAMVLASM